MIQAYKHERPITMNRGPFIIPEIIVKRKTEKETVEADGTRIIKPSYRLVNITKKINETAKTLKTASTAELEARLDEVFEVKKAELQKTIQEEKAKLKK